jgi:hypothetical protein
MRRSTTPKFANHPSAKAFDPLENDTLTARDVAEWYVELHHVLFGARPEVYHIEELWFWVDGARRDRHWLIVQVEQMRQRIVAARQEASPSECTEGAIYSSLRRMSRLI